MKTARILFRHMGENSTTDHTPYALVVKEEGRAVHAVTSGGAPLTVSLDETGTRCISADWDALTSVNVYQVREVELPDWFNPQRYAALFIDLKYYLGRGAEIDWPEAWFDKLSGTRRFSAAQVLACIKLLKTRSFKSAFRQHLRDQLEAWLADPEPRYDSPFSRRQWECLVNGYLALESKRLESSLYRS
jgi:hypothetical protein